MMHKNKTPQGLASDWLENHHLAKLSERQQMVKDLPVFKGSKILDVGCGTGNFMELFLSHPAGPATVVGLDRSAELLDIARKKIRGKGWEERSKLIHCDIDDSPSFGQSFDIVWCANTLLYSSDPMKTLQFLINCLKKNGYLVVKDEDVIRNMFLSWDPSFELALLNAWASVIKENESPSYDPYMGRKLFGLLKRSGLSEISAKTYLIERTYPLPESVQNYIFYAFNEYRDSYKKYLSKTNWQIFQDTFDPDSNSYLFKAEDLHFISTETVLSGRIL